jgi:hypothetical protein
MLTEGDLFPLLNEAGAAGGAVEIVTTNHNG